MIGKVLALGGGALLALYAVPKVLAKVKGTPPVQSSSSAGDVSSISPSTPNATDAAGNSPAQIADGGTLTGSQAGDTNGLYTTGQPVELNAFGPPAAASSDDSTANEITALAAGAGIVADVAPELLVL